MIGQTISHYKILEKLGEGGMGIVYKAHDTKLDRIVALKFLSMQSAADEIEQARFLQEAKAASALNHPNINTIFHLEDTHPYQFIVMEYIDGVTLRQKIGVGSIHELTLPDFLTYAIQIGEGLQEAHAKGVVHRDIKCENIMINAKNQIKIMDFGLAKLKDSVKLTKTSSTVGTLAYMAPEQIQGGKIDHRVDIFSFGVVLYEMMTGHLPFQGEHEAAMMYSIMNEEPQPMQKYRADVSPDVVYIISKALEKNADDRYQSASEMLVDLRRLKKQTTNVSSAQDVDDGLIGANIEWGRETSKRNKVLVVVSVILALVVGVFIWLTANGKNENTRPLRLIKIAILPFTPIRSDPEIDFLGFSLADQVITKLGYVKSAIVTPSGNVRKYSNPTTGLKDIGRELDVEILLTGNYIKEGDRFRLNAQLINVKNNEVLGSEALEVKYSDILTVQDAITQKVIELLRLSLAVDERQRIGKDIPKNPLAFEYYLKAGNVEVNSTKDIALQIELLKKSFELDSTYAPMLNALGWAYRSYSNYTGAKGNYSELPEQLFKRALEINKDSRIALINLGAIYSERGKVEEAAEMMAHAVTVYPNSPGLHYQLAYSYRYGGLLEQSLDTYRRALMMDTANTAILDQISKIFIYQGDYKKAISIRDSIRIILNAVVGSQREFDPTLFFYHGMAYYYGKDYQRASKMFDSCSSVDANNTWSLFGQVYNLVYLRDLAGARKVIAQLEMRNIADAEMAYRFTHFYSLIGDTNEALSALKKSIESGFFCYPYISTDPLLESIHGTRGYFEILQIAKKRHEAFKERFGK